MPRKNPPSTEPKLTVEDKKVLTPPTGVPTSPPDIDNLDSIFNKSAPTLSEIDHLKQNSLSTILEGVNVPHLERRITLLARLVLEDTLWTKDGLTKKERADIALTAIRTLEGSKSTIWLEDPNEKNLPKTAEAMHKEKGIIEARLDALLQSRRGLEKKRKQAAEDATAIIASEIENGVT